MRTLTERGLRWVVFSLALVLGANVLTVGFFFAFLRGQAIDVGTWTLVPAISEALLFASVAPGVLGFWRMRQGKRECGRTHAANMRRASVAFGIGAVSALVFFGTGVLLGFFYVPLTSAVGSTLRTAHQIAPILLVFFAGLFLLLSIWRLGTAVSRWLAIGALLAGILAPIVGILSSASPAPMLLWELAIALPAVSTGLWLATYLLETTRRRDATLQPSASPTTT